MDDLLAACLNASANITVYADIAPQNKVKSYGVYTVISNTKDNHSTGQGDLKEVRYQLDIYADKRSQAVALSDELQGLLLASSEFEAYVYQDFTEPDDEKTSYKSVVDFKLWK